MRGQKPERVHIDIRVDERFSEPSEFERRNDECFWQRFVNQVMAGSPSRSRQELECAVEKFRSAKSEFESHLASYL